MTADASGRAIYAEHLAAELRAVRARLKLSQTEMAELFSVHRNTVYRWETGNAMPDAFQMSELRSYLKSKGDRL